MRTNVQKWGNSLALRIPKSFAREMGLDHDVVVDLALLDNKLIVTAAHKIFTLEELLSGVTDDNLHNEVDMGLSTRSTGSSA
jgi:antitoxin MazE